MNFKDLFTTKNIILFFIIVLLIVSIYYYSTGFMKKSLEKMTNIDSNTTLSTAGNGNAPFQTQETKNINKPDASSSMPVRTASNPNDLLPNTAGSNWGNLYPVQNNEGVYVPSLIDPSFSIGINTISSTLKNPSLDLRSEPIIPKQTVSPWLNSSYEPNIAKIGLDPSPSVTV